MKEVVLGIILLLLGCAMIAFRRPFAREIIRQQNQTFGFRFGERLERASRYVIVAVGLGWVTLGVLACLGIIKMKA